MLLCACGEPTEEPKAVPSLDEYVCDVVPRQILQETMGFESGEVFYAHHHTDGAHESDYWLCQLESTDGAHLIKMEYTSADIWSTRLGADYVSPLKNSQPNARAFTLSDREGEGWIWGEYGNPLVWHYPNDYYLVISIGYRADAPSPDDSEQIMKNLATAVLDEVPAAAANPTSSSTDDN